MTSLRLNNDIRNRITDAAVEKQEFDTDTTELETQLLTLHEQVYMLAVDGPANLAKMKRAQREARARFDKIPTRFKYSSNNGNVYRTAYDLRIQFRGMFSRFFFPKSIENKTEYRITPEVYILDNIELGESIQEIKDKISDIKTAESRFRQTMNSFLSNFNTLKQLMEQWPEITEVMDVATLSPRVLSTSMTVSVAEINTMLKL